MQPPLQMQIPYSTLSQEDRESMVKNLNACLATLEKGVGRLSPSEIRVKSMLTVLRNELRTALNESSLTEPPFKG
jgi:chaperonin cofactor prefoldin